MRTVYLGTSEFASTVLEELAASAHRPQLVVTRPDAKRGRGRKLSAPPVAETARLRGIEVFQPENVNDEAAGGRIAAAKPDAVLICAYGALIREPLLSAHRMLNVHPSLLPRWRGAAPIERAIEAGDEETGVTIMQPVAELDEGPIAVQRAEAIRPDDDYGSLSKRLAALGGELLVEALDLRERGELELRDQDDSEATYAEKVDPAERKLDPVRPAEELARVVRALGPRLGTHLELEGGERLGVRAATALAEGPPQGDLEAGDQLVLGCASGGLRLDVVQPPGGRAMDAEAFLRGHTAPVRAL
jgi:methionyl-tRNA formyltransferase